ncbi:hypothetical protein QFZ69_002523 [Arthrobacter sp. V1I7]|nr:hypothetical protein [Arthrobacter sp. V1I7]
MNAPWSWRSSSSEGSAPSWSIASVQLRATRTRKSGSFSAAGPGQGMLHPDRGLIVAEVPDPVQHGCDDARGPGCDLRGGYRGAEFLTCGRLLPAAETGAGEQFLGEDEPAPCLRGADQQPGPQKLGGVPVPVVRGPGFHPCPVCSGRPVRLHRPGGNCRSAHASAHTPGFAAAGSVPPASGPARGRGAPAGRGCGLLPGAVHGGGCDELQILHRPGQFLHPAGEVGRGLESPERRVRYRRRAHFLEHREGGVHTGIRGLASGLVRVLEREEIPDAFHG